MTREKCFLLNVKLATLLDGDNATSEYDLLPSKILLLYGNYELRENVFKIVDKFYIFWYDIDIYNYVVSR